VAAAVDRQKLSWEYLYYQFVRGLAEYRHGEFGRAITTLRGDAGRRPGPTPQLVLAMALQRDGREAEARQTLAAAVVRHDWRASQVKDQDGWVEHALRREAEGLILPGLRGFVDHHDLPQDSNERLILLGDCQFTNRNLTAARLFTAAFADAPALAADFKAGHRSSAARYAALAGCGRGTDVAGLSDPERAVWRTRAREWLRADLAAWGKALTQTRPPPARTRRDGSSRGGPTPIWTGCVRPPNCRNCRPTSGRTASPYGLRSMPHSPGASVDPMALSPVIRSSRWRIPTSAESPSGNDLVRSSLPHPVRAELTELAGFAPGTFPEQNPGQPVHAERGGHATKA
jgi:serine/threonine-protein kinase